MPSDELQRFNLALALDTPDLKLAQKLSGQLSDFFGVVKIGLTLWAAEGPNAVKKLESKERRIFLDLKLHDIPHQVKEASKALAGLGVDYITMHSAGGRQMLEAGVAEFQAASRPAKVLAVTLLTSQPNLDEEDFLSQVELAGDAGCAGIVCSVNEIALAKAQVPDIFCAVPGIRQKSHNPQYLKSNPQYLKSDDQARPGTLQDAVRAGADLLVIGRPVTQAPNPLKAARELLTLGE